MSLEERWSRQLDELRGQGRLRTLRIGQGVDFASNDYLGYAARIQPEVPAIGPLLSRSGSASRLLRGQHALWDQVETALARWHGAEAALVFNSGYTANQGLLATVIERGDWVASDALNHASVIDGLRLSGGQRYVYRHRDLGDLESGLRAAPAGATRFVVTESLFSMDGDVAPLADLVRLAQEHAAHVVVDEAHATGCFGPQGSGLVDQLGLRGRVLATVHTGGKALGVPGAYVCGSDLLKQILINRCRHFIFTTALPPLVASWWLDTLGRVRHDDEGRARLHANALLFRGALRENGIDAPGDHYIVPVLLGDDRRATVAAERLQQRGFDIRAIRPPTVPIGTSRLRVSIHADHDPDILKRAAAAVAEAAS
jgi:8-amino-7-oxononanoate synthase